LIDSPGRPHGPAPGGTPSLARPPARAIREDNILLIGPWAAEEDDWDKLDYCTLALVIAYPGYATPYHALARRLRAEKIPFSLVIPHLPVESLRKNRHDVSSLAAYFTIEDPTPCWRCLELRYLSWSSKAQLEADYFDFLKKPGASGPPTVSPEPEELIMLRWLALDVTGTDPGTARFVHGDGEFKEHTFRPHPNCMYCSPWAGVVRDEVHNLKLNDMVDERLGLIRPLWVADVLDHEPRATPEETRFSLETRRSKYAYDVANPAPYWVPPRRVDVDTLLEPIRQYELDGDERRAERLRSLAAYAAALRAGRPTWRGTRAGIPLPAEDPRKWRLYRREEDVFASSYREEREYDWIRAHALLDGHDVGIPADLVFTGMPRDTMCGVDLRGVVAHPSLEVAVRLALAHTAEHDALVEFPRGSRVAFDTLPAAQRGFVNDAQNAGFDVLVLDVSTALEVPVILVLARSRDNNPQWFAGSAADLIPEVALQRAFRALRTISGDTPHFYRNLGVPGWERLALLPQRPLRTALPTAYSDPIDTWRAHLARTDRSAAWADITPPDVGETGIVVVRAFLSRPEN
jgi:hypothetical protein